MLVSGDGEVIAGDGRIPRLMRSAFPEVPVGALVGEQTGHMLPKRNDAAAPRGAAAS